MIFNTMNGDCQNEKMREEAEKRNTTVDFCKIQ